MKVYFINYQKLNYICINFSHGLPKNLADQIILCFLIFKFGNEDFTSLFLEQVREKEQDIYLNSNLLQ